jgi:glycosyltransferase involved in cell wall biosynthesis
MRISVITPCRNESRYIRAFLDTLLAQQLEPGQELEILVADGMSDDGTTAILAEYSAQHPLVRVIENPGRIVSTGLNAAIEASNGELIVRMDAHTTYAPDYIRECVRAIAVSNADNVGGPWVAEGRGWIGRAIASAFRVRFCTGGGKAHDPDYEGEVDTVYLGCWPRRVFAKVGLFDPGLVRNQDDEFNLRLHRAGGKVWQSPRIKSAYSSRGSLKGVFRQYMQYGFWKVAVMRKHAGLASMRQMVPAIFVAANLVLLGLALLQPLFFQLWLAMLALYLVAAFAAATGAARRDGWDLLPVLPLVFLTYHVGYGSGFLWGLLYWPLASSSQAGPSEAFTKLTR